MCSFCGFFDSFWNVFRDCLNAVILRPYERYLDVLRDCLNMLILRSFEPHLECAQGVPKRAHLAAF